MNSPYGELVNLDNTHYSKVLVDTEDAYQTGANSYLAPAGEMKHEAKADISTRYYDGKPMFTTVTEGATKVAIKVSGVPMKKAAELTGKPYDATKGIMLDTGDPSKAPDYAMSGRMELGDGGYRFFQYLKGKFSVGAQTAKSREDKTNVNTIDLEYTAMTTIHKFDTPEGEKNLKGLFADTTDPAFIGGDNWFAQVQTPDTLGAPGALTLTSTPANNATGVIASIHPTLTFSNAIASDAITVMKVADGTVVGVTKSYDAAGKVLTITPTAALTSSGVYSIIVAGVKDVLGQSLETSTIKFTIA